MRKPSYTSSRAKPENRVLKECIFVDECSECILPVRKKIDVDESFSDDESGDNFIEVRVIEICYYLLTLSKFQLNACYLLPHIAPY